MRITRLVGAVVASAMLFVGSAAAQNDDLQAQVEDLQSRYEQAWTAGDAEALAGLFTEDAIFWPLGGGSFEGRDNIQQAMQQEPTPETADIRSTRTERIGDMVLDVGTFSATLPEAQGGAVEGEYVVIVNETGDGPAIHRLIAFQPRRAPQQAQ